MRARPQCEPATFRAEVHAQKRFHAEPDTEALPEPVAARLLTRASELDAARAAVLTVADLRAAAGEAGISACAFDAALAELQGTGQARVPDVREQPRRRSRLWRSSSRVRP